MRQENYLKSDQEPISNLSLADQLVHCDYQAKKKELAKEILFLRQYGQFQSKQTEKEPEEYSR